MFCLYHFRAKIHGVQESASLCVTLIVFKSVSVYDSDGLTGSFVWLVGRGRMIYDQVYDCRCSAAELFPEED